MSDELPPALPAATLIVLREQAAGPPAILMVERSPAMAFAPGSLVFPGGRVEAADHHPEVPSDQGDGAARVAAIRETIEEAGIAIGIEPPIDAAAIDRWRTRLWEGQSLFSLLREDDVNLDTTRLQSFARWRPSHRVTRIYDARFYLACWSEAAGEPRVDATENVRAFWSTAQDTLTAIEAGDAKAIFPTICNLQRLARFATVDEAFVDARTYPPTTITPWVEARDGRDYLCIPEGLGYPITAVMMETADRG